ncbi:MAG TPA: hypothetical protein VFA68_19620 [Terriglobales bacterium]|nr:hypothetical protein [Terriglobales bacterium]
MFEQEVELEKSQSSILPLLIIVVAILTIVGVSGYYVIEARRVLTNQEASAVATDVLKLQGPATVHFHTGMVKASVNDKPHDPHYRLLEKAGVISIGKDTGQYGQTTPVSLTQQGERLVNELGATVVKEKDGTQSYTVPLAMRTLSSVDKVNMISPSRATVDITWKWEPNKLGNLFDASGSLVKGFSTWDRATLIQKYGADFYHGEPTKVTLAMMKGDKGWQIAIE